MDIIDKALAWLFPKDRGPIYSFDAKSWEETKAKARAGQNPCVAAEQPAPAGDNLRDANGVPLHRGPGVTVFADPPRKSDQRELAAMKREHVMTLRALDVDLHELLYLAKGEPAPGGTRRMTLLRRFHKHLHQRAEEATAAYGTSP